ncbi:hypothetical protein SAMN03097708_00831 [Thiohalomonas denitrificans]|uniref:Uncharacterized protein n=1 Tax=Thiohalomonas denitrificans TaxID=415747 RepID=A0A1G5PU29_9GAMM|nr:hypothetical protein SAMN03097708_00831 [Thiohalomonas denitrificans]
MAVRRASSTTHKWGQTMGLRPCKRLLLTLVVSGPENTLIRPLASKKARLRRPQKRPTLGRS